VNGLGSVGGFGLSGLAGALAGAETGAELGSVWAPHCHAGHKSAVEATAVASRDIFKERLRVV